MALQEIPMEIIKDYNPAINSEKELIETMYKTMSIRQMAKIIGYSSKFFMNRMIKYGIPRRGKNVTSNSVSYLFENINTEKIKSMTQKEIAIKCNCSIQHAGWMLRKNGLKYKSDSLKKGEKHARRKK